MTPATKVAAQLSRWGCPMCSGLVELVNDMQAGKVQNAEALTKRVWSIVEMRQLYRCTRELPNGRKARKEYVSSACESLIG